MAKLYENSNISITNLDRIILPKFQRGLVWSKQSKTDFVKTLHEGFPFGSILVYPENIHDTSSKLLLLDGQQRLSTIVDLQNNPLDYFVPLHSEVLIEAAKNINSYLEEETEIDAKFLINILSGDLSVLLPNWTDDLEISKNDKIEVRKIVNNINKEIKEFTNLDSLEIPIIKFLGDKSDLSRVFENLNKGGVSLTKYEIFNASWAHTEILLPTQDENSEKVLDCIIENYEKKIEDSAFEINDFSRDELKQDRKITLAELGIGLGLFAQDLLPSLIPPHSKNAHSEIGFGLLGIATGVDNKKLGNLSEHADFLNQNILEILEKVANISKHLDATFSKFLKIPNPSGSVNYQNGLSTSFKTLSYYAALWNEDINSESFRQILDNLIGYYIYDSLNNSWGSHGDTRLYEYYPKTKSRNYETPLDKSEILQAFISWQNDRNAGINFTPEVKALVAIHANLTYLAKSKFNGDKLELEHIIPKKKINLIEGTPKKIYGNSLGNCMYLIKTRNNGKKENTLYTFAQKNPSEKEKIFKLVKESDYPSSETFDHLEIYFGEKNF
ncbi:MAG: DUF262 domain-containing protein, partial [Rothia sp. (in: high G+C Gram-positive bacteria)]|nr:DUF262 domain-containing protein [Rothia sp. (in: high G+C Gram-positive bacteria)]